MAKYYEEAALIEFVKKYTPTINGETTMECVERAIREAPAADVVSRAEVEKAKQEADRLAVELEAALAEDERLKAENTKLNGDVEIWKQNRFNIFQTIELYQKAREKFAREIFKEIFTIIRAYEFDALVAKENYGIMQVRNFGTDILKLKKKYVGGEGDEGED